MNSLLFCVILSVYSCRAFKVSFHTVDLKIYKYERVPVLVCTQHEFIYHRGEAFTMYLQLPNNSIKAAALVNNESGMTYLREFWPEGRPIHIHLNFDKITIDVELSVNNTCVRERILEGREVSTAGTNIMAFKYNDICLNKNHCLVYVTPNEECIASKLTPLPCEYGRYVEILEPEEDQRTQTTNEIKNNPDTSRAKDDSKGAENTYFIIMIITSLISAVALTLLLVIVMRHRCYIHNPPGNTHIPPTNENPFYENMLFRKECQQEIEELEQREYDVVAEENEYVEICNHSSPVAASTPPHTHHTNVM